MEVHCEEKMARAHSAVIVVEEEARQIENAKALATTVSVDSTASPGEPTRFENDAAIYEDGQVFLQGNPLATTKEIICTRCRLPRLLNPTAGVGGVLPEPNKKYCSRHPAINKSGHDIWGNPFATDPVSGSKAKKDKKGKDAASSKGSPAASPPPAETKTAVTFPSVKCPSCNRYFCVTRLTPHLEKCMAVNVRDASRKAKAKIELNNSRNSSTPHGSRRGTPIPGSQHSTSNKRGTPDDDDDDEDETPKKKRKKIVRKPVDKEQTPKAKKLKDLPAAARPSPSPKPTPQPEARKISKVKVLDSEDESDVPVAPKKKILKITSHEDGAVSKPGKLKGTSNDHKLSNGTAKKPTPDLPAPRDKEKPHNSSPLSKPKSSPEKNGSIGTAALNAKKRKLEEHQQNGDGESTKGDNDPFHKRSKKQHPETPSVPAVEV